MTLPTDLARTDACLDVADFEDDLTTEARAHVESCARCQTEQRLWMEFQAATPTSDEGAAVSWIVRELERRAPGAPVPTAAHSRWSWWRLTTGLGAIAAALVAVVGYSLVGRTPTIRDVPPGTEIYRNAEVILVAPVGDIVAAPHEFTWSPVTGAVRYDVVLAEVDRTVLWRTTQSSPRVSLPTTITQQIVAGKTLLWSVNAMDAAGHTVASSGWRPFRVTLR